MPNKDILTIDDSDGKLHLYVCAAFHGKRRAAQIVFDEDKGTMGRMTSERAFTERGLESYPPPLQRSNGRMLLLEQLAGVGAQIIIDQSDEHESILSYMEEEDWCGEEDTSTDSSRARRIARIMAKPYMPAHRILNMAEKWTMEMLRISAVWSVVEIVAGKLIEHGELEKYIKRE